MTISVPNFMKSSVLVVGDVMLDRYWYGLTNRISPESPVPIVKINNVVDSPGGAANVAMNIAALGGKTRLIGLTGVDEASEILKKQLTASKIKWNFIPIYMYPTIIKLRVISRNQQLIRLDFEKESENINIDQFIKTVKLYLSQYKVLVLSDYAKGALNSIEEIISLSKHYRIPVIVDPKGLNFSRYKGSTLLTPNMSEFEGVVGHCYNESIMIKRAQEVMFDYCLSALLITRSERGMILFKPKSDPIFFETTAKNVCDVTGAGDTVVAVLSAALSSGESLEKSCFLANFAAGIVIGKFGTSTINITDLENIVKSYGYSKVKFGIVNEETLKRSVSLIRSQGETIVMTNGVFDILHYGHISYLIDAKKLGDRLIVAVNSDDSVKRLKGNTRPVNTLENRMFVLSALSMVDWVIPFYEDTPIRLIKDISPDFLVKGGDYKIDDIDGSQEVIRKGGKVCILDLKSGYSSSRIIDALNNVGYIHKS